MFRIEELLIGRLSCGVDERQVLPWQGHLLEQVHELVLQLPSSVGHATASQRRILVHLDATIPTRIGPKL